MKFNFIMVNLRDRLSTRVRRSCVKLCRCRKKKSCCLGIKSTVNHYRMDQECLGSLV